MANRPSALRQSDLTRYAMAMKKAGVEDWRVDIKPDGTVSIIANNSIKVDDSTNDWDHP
jgi:uncharacterized protein YbcV (DUF1398 family)